MDKLHQDLASGSVDVLAPYRARYKELCAQRDKTNAEIAEDQRELAQAVELANEAAAKAKAIAQRISDKRGGAKWLMLKKEIGVLARAMGGK